MYVIPFVCNMQGAKGSPCAVAMADLEVSDQQNRLKTEARFRMLRLLEQNPEMSQRDLAGAVGISTGSTHYILRALIDKGLVKLGNFTACRHKRRYAYVLTPKGVALRAALTREFLAHKIREYDALKSEIEMLSRELDTTDAETRS